MTATPEQARAALRALLDARLEGSPAASWMAEQSRTTDLEAIRRVLPDVGRGVGRRPLIAAFAERAAARVESANGPLAVGEWTTDGAARVLLLAAAADTVARPYRALFETYDAADTETRVAALRALNFVATGDPTDGLALVLDAGRTYLTELMGAAWCDNPFSAEHLSDHDYRKAVLKAFFCNIPVGRFQRLEERSDAELAQSLCEYADEREAAGRAVPGAVWIVAGLHPRPGLVARLIGKIEHPLAEERLAAAGALANARDPRAAPFLRERLERETDGDVRGALEAALARIED